MPALTRRSMLTLLSGLPLAALARAPGEAGATSKATGNLETHEAFASRNVVARTVRVWLPPDYEQGEACSVLYMHDGQNLFAPANPFNHGPWDVDRRLLALREQGQVRKTLVVGIDSRSGIDRLREYAPQSALERVPAPLRERGLGPEGEPLLGEAYLRFLVEELKPWVDGRYRTQAQAAATTIMGSSLGGLASLHALVRYPQVFGAAGCLSTHWPVATGLGFPDPKLTPEAQAMAGAVLDWLQEVLPPAGSHRLYFDHGDQTLDSLYAPFQMRMDAIAGEKGYRSADYLSRSFPGAAHDEAAWRSRLGLPLGFLLQIGRS